MTAPSEPTVFTLSRITGRIAEILKPVAEKSFWVQAEIGDVSDKGGHYYGALVETKNGKQVAKLAFRMWNNDRTRIAAVFQQAGLALELKSGMKVILECHVEFHELYGLSLVATNADPRFILGELELRKREIIERLRQSGADKKNKQWRVPLLPMRIGIITSRDSAAYFDVFKTLKQGGFAYRVSFTDAVMQGDNAEASILRGLELFDRLGVDLVVLIRGGGSKTDLATLDNERIALAIAAFSKPVWVAIGHETDSSVLDVVAHTSFKTPTALAEEIVGRFERAVVELRTAEARIRREWSHLMELQRREMEKNVVGIMQGSRKLSELARSELNGAMERMRRRVGERTASEHRANDMQRKELRTSASRTVEGQATMLREGARSLRTLAGHALQLAGEWKELQRSRLSRERIQAMLDLRTSLMRSSVVAFAAAGRRTSIRHAERLSALMDRLKTSNVQARLTQEHVSLGHRHRNVLAYDPRKALERGYTIVTNSDGRILKSVDAVDAGMLVGIEFHDGAANAEISSKEKHHE